MGRQICRGWWHYFLERFPPFIAIPSVFLFSLANSAIARQMLDLPFNLTNTLIAFGMAVCFFFRLQLFGDIRDYKSDCQWYPHKPLPRGLISVEQATIVAFSLIFVELLMASFVGIQSVYAHLLPVSWSLLMYVEFFSHRWLCAHPTTYAMVRSPVLAFCGYSVGVTAVESSLILFPLAFFLFGIANWAVFNLYEFSRHTSFGADSVNYRYMWGTWGALLLIVVQMVLLAWTGDDIWLWIGLLPILVLMGIWALQHNDRYTKRMKTACLLYILYFYFILSL